MLGTVLGDIRRRARETQEGLARRLGVRRNTVCRWELGERTPDPGTLDRILTVLEATDEDRLAALAAAGGRHEVLDASAVQTPDDLVQTPGEAA